MRKRTDRRYAIGTVVKQGCALSPFLLLLHSLANKGSNQCQERINMDSDRHPRRCWLCGWNCVLCSALPRYPIENNDVPSIDRQSGLTSNTNKTKLMRDQCKIRTTDYQRQQEYWRSTWISLPGQQGKTDGNSEIDVLHRLTEARGTFATVWKFWTFSKTCTETKLRIYKNNVLGVLLYGTDTWKVSQSMCHKIDVLQTRWLRRILRIFRPRTTCNEDLYRRNKTVPLTVKDERRWWRWTGHINKMNLNAISRVAVRWTPAGKRKRGN